jgi:hypothetical protein
MLTEAGSGSTDDQSHLLFVSSQQTPKLSLLRLWYHLSRTESAPLASSDPLPKTASRK